MNVVHTLADLKQALPSSQTGCALVPTMGNLHEGHLTLVKQARSHGLPVVASIFVNRLQFAPHEDFDLYPRTLQRDTQMLRDAGCDLVFAPSEADLYPAAQTCRVYPDPALADILEGEFRPGFFIGVCTVVMKLFACVQPKIAVFGKKDYQQLLVIRHMVEQLMLPIQVDAASTLRAQDGLALSSRNGYLSASERIEAIALNQALRQLAQDVAEKPHERLALEARAMATMAQQGWQPDYLTVRQRSNLRYPPDAASNVSGTLIALGAARLGQTRLIDNVEC